MIASIDLLFEESLSNSFMYLRQNEEDISNNTILIDKSATTSGHQEDDEIGFGDLYLQFERDTEEENVNSITLARQLLEVRAIRHFVYCHSKNIV